MTSVYFTIPNGSAWMHKLTHFASCKILADSRYRVRHDAPTHTPYVNNLHHCIKDFLNGGEDYWLSFDDDNPPINNPLDLIELDCDLIGLPTPVWANMVPGDRPYYFNALTKEDGGYRPLDPETGGLHEVDAIGSGCFIVSRRVIEALKDDMPFMREWGKDGTVQKGGDYSFCDKVKAKGFRIFAHYDYMCHHFNELDLMEVIKAFGSMNRSDVS